MNDTNAVILTHPLFNRPPVHQPNPRKRKGTLSFKKARKKKESHKDRALRLARPGKSIREMAADIFAQPILLRVPHEELESVLRAGGLCLGVSMKEGAGVIMRDLSPGFP